MKLVFIAAISIGLTATAFAGTTIYGLKSRSPGGAPPSASPTHLFTFDGTLGGVTDLGSVTYNGNEVDADALAWHGGNLYAFLLEAGGSRLVTINPTTAVATSLAFYQDAYMRGLTARGNTLYGLDVLAGVHYRSIQIDIVSLSLTSVAMDTGISDGCDLDFDSQGTLWLTDYNAFHTLNPVTGVVTFVVADNVPDPQGFSVFNPGFVFDETTPLRALTFEANNTDDIMIYSLPSAARSTMTVGIIPGFNSGRGDLTAVPEPGALAALGLGLLALVARKRR